MIPYVVSASTAHKCMAQYVNAHYVEQSGRHYATGTDLTKEVLHYGISIADPRQRIVLTRPINPAFAIAEVIWILAGSNDLSYVRFWNGIMGNFSDDGVSLHGAYGARLGSKFITWLDAHPSSPISINDQLARAYTALAASPTSRQVVLNIYDQRYDSPEQSPRSKDIPCNITSMLLVRDNALYWLQTMRSNDLMWGTPYNFIQWTMLQEVMAGWLGVELGHYTHMVNSLHVYKQHFADLEAVCNVDYPVLQSSDYADLRLPYADSKLVWNELAKLSLRMMELKSKAKATDECAQMLNVIAYDVESRLVHYGYKQLAYTLLAEVSRKYKMPAELIERFAANAGPTWGLSFNMWWQAKQTKTPLL